MGHMPTCAVTPHHDPAAGCAIIPHHYRDALNMADEQRRQKLEETDPHSERLSETASEKQKEERRREKAREKPEIEGSGRKPVELRTTSRSELDERIEEKEGRQVARTSEEMSLHEEISRTREDEEDEE